MENKGLKDKEPFKRIDFRIDMAKISAEDRVALMKIIKKYKGEKLAKSQEGVWNTYIPIDDAGKFILSVKKYKPIPTEEIKQFSKFKPRTSELKTGKGNEHIKFYNYSISETDPPEDEGWIYNIGPNYYGTLISYTTDKKQSINLRNIDQDNFYHRDFGKIVPKYIKLRMLNVDANEPMQTKLRLLDIVKKHGGKYTPTTYNDGGKAYVIIPADNEENFIQDASEFDPYEAETIKTDFMTEEETMINEARSIIRKMFKGMFYKK